MPSASCSAFTPDKRAPCVRRTLTGVHSRLAARFRPSHQTGKLTPQMPPGRLSWRARRNLARNCLYHLEPIQGREKQRGILSEFNPSLKDTLLRIVVSLLLELGRNPSKPLRCKRSSAGMCEAIGEIRFWHLADIGSDAEHVRFWGEADSACASNRPCINDSRVLGGSWVSRCHSHPPS